MSSREGCLATGLPSRRRLCLSLPPRRLRPSRRPALGALDLSLESGDRLVPISGPDSPRVSALAAHAAPAARSLRAGSDGSMPRWSAHVTPKIVEILLN